MLVQAQRATALAKAAVKNAVSNVPHAAMRSAPRGAKPAAKPSFSMESLWRLAAWASTAAMALFVAVVATRSDGGSDRVSGALASLHLASPPSHAAPAPTQLASQTAGTPSSRSSELDATTRQLTQAVRILTEDRDRLAARVASLERNVDDITGIDQPPARRETNGASSHPGQPGSSGEPAKPRQPSKPDEPGERALAQRTGSSADDTRHRCRCGRPGRAGAGRRHIRAAALGAHARPRRGSTGSRQGRLRRRSRRRPFGDNAARPLGGNSHRAPAAVRGLGARRRSQGRRRRPAPQSCG